MTEDPGKHGKMGTGMTEDPGKHEKTDMPLISVIVPVYNVKEYMGSCLDSILAQTYANLEILLVDDGSTDGSGELCDRYAQKDARIKVIHQENRGLSGARNTGLDHAEGDYIAFVDSDDMIREEFLQTLYELTVKYGAEIAACLFDAYTENHAPAAGQEAAGQGAAVKKTAGQDTAVKKAAGQDTAVKKAAGQGTAVKKTAGQRAKEICLDSQALLKQWHGKYKKYETVSWNKLYHRSVFSQGESRLRFPAGRNHEDMLTSHLFVQNAKKVAMIGEVLYIYRKREGSITNSGISKAYAESNLAAQRERMQYFRSRKYYKSLLNLWKGYILHKMWFAVKT